MDALPPVEPPAIVYSVRQELSAFPLTGAALANAAQGALEEQPFGDVVVARDGAAWVNYSLEGQLLRIPAGAQAPQAVDASRILPAEMLVNPAFPVALTTRTDGAVSALYMAQSAQGDGPQYAVVHFGADGTTNSSVHLSCIDSRYMDNPGLTVDARGLIWVRELGRTTVFSRDGRRIRDLPAGVVLPEGKLVSNESEPRVYASDGQDLGEVNGLPKGFSGPWQLAGPGPVLMAWDTTEAVPRTVNDNLLVMAVYALETRTMTVRLDDRIAWPIETRRQPGPGELGDALPLSSIYDAATLSANADGHVFLLQYTPASVHVHGFRKVPQPEQHWRAKFSSKSKLTEAEIELYVAEYLARLGLLGERRQGWGPYFAPLSWKPLSSGTPVTDEDRSQLEQLAGRPIL